MVKSIAQTNRPRPPIRLCTTLPNLVCDMRWEGVGGGGGGGASVAPGGSMLKTLKGSNAAIWNVYCTIGTQRGV